MAKCLKNVFFFSQSQSQKKNGIFFILKTTKNVYFGFSLILNVEYLIEYFKKRSTCLSLYIIPKS